MLLLAGPPSPGLASSLTVPDDAPTIQAALDQLVDTVLVRPAAYPEVPVISYQVCLSSASGDLQASRPSLRGLYITPAWVPFIPRFDVSRLDVDDPVYIRNDNIPCYINFTDCRFNTGIDDLTDYVITAGIQLRRCVVGSGAHLKVDGICTLDSCAVNGDLSVENVDVSLFVKDCVFTGPGFGTAITTRSGWSCAVERSSITAFDLGMNVYGEDSVLVARNAIADCPAYGVWANGNNIAITDNTIRNCGTGVLASTYTAVKAERNLVQGSSAVGISVGTGGSALICENVVWGSGLDGLRVGGYGGGMVVCQNTSSRNGGAGISSEGGFTGPSEYLYVTGNVGFENGDVGMEWVTPNATVVACNDWFGNAMGDVRGRAPSDGDFSLDPQFCDAVGGDFRLQDTSPLVDRAGCGQVGALGVGCALTATLVQRFAAQRSDEGIRVVWELAAGATAAQVWLERSEGTEGGAWMRPLTERSLENRAVVELDRGALWDHAYRYRLVAREGEGTAVLGEPIVVSPGARVSFRLAEVGPSPGGGPVRIAFGLARPADIEIAVFDVLGRRIASPALGPWPAGSHDVQWDGREPGGEQAPPGIYVVRYAYPGGEDRRRIARVR